MFNKREHPSLFRIIIAMFACLNTVYAACNNNDIPKVIKPMADWEIIATNAGIIPMASVFKGDNLTYSISSHPKNRKNIISINNKTGVIHIKAAKKDNFDITIKAENTCGTAINTFNVIIDEEE